MLQHLMQQFIPVVNLCFILELMHIYCWLELLPRKALASNFLRCKHKKSQKFGLDGEKEHRNSTFLYLPHEAWLLLCWVTFFLCFKEQHCSLLIRLGTPLRNYLIRIVWCILRPHYCILCHLTFFKEEPIKSSICSVKFPFFLNIILYWPEVPADGILISAPLCPLIWQ